MYEPKASKTSNRQYFEIGYIGDKRWFTNIAVNHANGQQTNETLVSMSDEELKRYTNSELYYTYSDDGKERQSRSMHRAYFILQFRREKRYNDLEKQEFFKKQEAESIESLMANEPAPIQVKDMTW